MAKSARRLERILERMAVEIRQAGLYLAIAKVLGEYDWRCFPEITSSFFSGCMEACTRETVLSLSKLTLGDPESITIQYLLDHVHNHPKIFRFADPSAIQQLAASHRARLESFAPFFAEIRALRDRTLAHLDRKHINEPATIGLDTIPLGEIERCLTAILEMLNDYHEAYGLPLVEIASIEQRVREAVGQLVDHPDLT